MCSPAIVPDSTLLAGDDAPLGRRSHLVEVGEGEVRVGHLWIHRSAEPLRSRPLPLATTGLGILLLHDHLIHDLLLHDHLLLHKNLLLEGVGGGVPRVRGYVQGRVRLVGGGQVVFPPETRQRYNQSSRYRVCFYSTFPVPGTSVMSTFCTFDVPWSMGLGVWVTNHPLIVVQCHLKPS